MIFTFKLDFDSCRMPDNNKLVLYPCYKCPYWIHSNPNMHFFCQEMVIKFQDLQIEHTAKLNEMKTKRKRLCLFPNRWVLSTSVIDLTYTSMFFQLMGRDKSTKTSSWNIQKNSRKQKIRYRCDVTHLLTFYFKNWTHFHWFKNGVLLEGIYLGNYISYNLPLLPLIIL